LNFPNFLKFPNFPVFLNCSKAARRVVSTRRFFAFFFLAPKIASRFVGGASLNINRTQNGGCASEKSRRK